MTSMRVNFLLRQTGAANTKSTEPSLQLRKKARGSLNLVLSDSSDD